MMRVIVNPAVLPPEALAELKDWLGISTTLDDAPLSALLATALDVCADFTGMVPIVCQCEEALPTPQHWQQFLPAGNWMQPVPRPMLQGNRDFGWHALSTRPVQMVNAVYQIAPDGTRTALDPSTYQVRIDADGTGRIKLVDPGQYPRLVANFNAGMALSWDQLPTPIHHGIIRLAAHQHRTREADGAAPLPPASVAALWRPWRQVRLA